MRDQITPVILTRDEAPNIGRTLAQLSWAKDVIVVDSFSTDETLQIARSFPNVRVLQRPLDDLASQSAFGVAQSGTPWVLLLDADYFVTDELVRELGTLQPATGVYGYIAEFGYAIGGRPLRASLYPARVVLLHRDYTELWQDGHTPRIRILGDTATLRGKVIHDDRKSFRRFLQRQRRYMRQEASKLRRTSNDQLNLPGRIRKLIFVAPFAVLVHTLFVKRLALDGLPGLHYTAERVVAETILSTELLRRTASAAVRLPLRLVPDGRVMTIKSGALKGWRWISGSATHSAWLGTYEKPVQKLFEQHVTPGMTVYDVGANVGFYSLLASRLTGPAGRVIAFEPLPRNLEFLRRHKELNGAENITVQPVATAAQSGTARFRTAASAAMGAVRDDGDIEVSTVSLDDAIASGLPLPQLIKMDIEGGESEALRGATRMLAARPLTIILSTHGSAQHEQCTQILREAGFELQLMKDGAADGDYLLLATA